MDTFPQPSPALIKEVKENPAAFLEACVKYRYEAVLVLEDGSAIQPTVAATFSLMKTLTRTRRKASIPVEGNAVPFYGTAPEGA